MKNLNQNTAMAPKLPAPGTQPTALADVTVRQDSSESSTNAAFAWLTVSEAAEYLKVKPRTLLSWARKGAIQAYTLAGTKRRIWRFRRADLDETLLSRPVLPSSTPTVLSPERRTV